MVTTEVLIGIVGAGLLIVAWLWEAWENVTTHKISIHTHFAVLYIIGNILLLIYSWLIDSLVFFVLGFFLIVAILAEMIYATKIIGVKTHGHKRRK